MSIKLIVPDIGDFEEVEIIEILVKSGDNIKKNDPIATLESDKSSVEVPSEFDGKVEKINVKIGDKVSKGDLLITLSESIIQNDNKKDLTSPKKNLIDKIPTDTENIIKDAENILRNKEEKQTIIKVTNENDIDPIETQEWLESISAVLERDGKDRAQFLIKELIDHSYKEGSDLVLSRNTPYINTISPESEIDSK